MGEKNPFSSILKVLNHGRFVPVVKFSEYFCRVTLWKRMRKRCAEMHSEFTNLNYT